VIIGIKINRSNGGFMPMYTYFFVIMLVLTIFTEMFLFLLSLKLRLYFVFLIYLFILTYKSTGPGQIGNKKEETFTSSRLRSRNVLQPTTPILPNVLLMYLHHLFLSFNCLYTQILHKHVKYEFRKCNVSMKVKLNT
jgi:hypothetical protein